MGSEMMDLAAISAFVTVGESGGFRSAATILGMTSSGVSKAITRLEKKLGVQLLARTTRSVRLTPAGTGIPRAMPGNLGRASGGGGLSRSAGQADNQHVVGGDGK